MCMMHVRGAYACRGMCMRAVRVVAEGKPIYSYAYELGRQNGYRTVQHSATLPTPRACPTVPRCMLCVYGLAGGADERGH